MEKRAVLALALSFLIIATYPYILRRLYPTAATGVPHAAGPVEGNLVTAGAKPAQTPSESVEPITRTPVSISNSQVELRLDDRDASILGISLSDPKLPSSAGGVLLFQQNAMGATLLSFQAAEGSPVTSKLEHGTDFVRVISTYPSGITAIREIKLDASKFSAQMQIGISNPTNKPQSFSYKLGTPGPLSVQERQDIRFVEILTKSEGRIFHERIHGAAKKGVHREAPIEWIASKSRYFSVIFKPLLPGVSVEYKPAVGSGLYGELQMPPLAAESGKEAFHRFLIYTGPSDYHLLKSYDAGLEESVFTGFTGAIGWGLMEGLVFLQKIFRNWGVAIVLLTLTISAILSPFTLKSMKSIKQMQALQPQLAKLREQYKASPEKLNKEMLELYRKHKVNPLGGCLPMILQMPVFFALYNVLMRSVQLKGADFLWIKDLALPDRFWQLPKPFPVLGDSIHLLPLLAIILIMVQQRFSQTATSADPSQKMLAWVMPFVFGLIFYGFPSGFLLYFLTSSGVSVAFQFWALRLAPSSISPS